MQHFYVYGPIILQYGPALFGFLSAVFWIFAALVKVPDRTNPLRKQCRYIAVASLFAAVMILLQVICHWTGYY